jgi:hypothetical protein
LRQFDITVGVASHVNAPRVMILISKAVVHQALAVCARIDFYF